MAVGILLEEVSIFFERVDIISKGPWLYITECASHKHKEDKFSNNNLHC